MKAERDSEGQRLLLLLLRPNGSGSKQTGNEAALGGPERELRSLDRFQLFARNGCY